MWVNNELVGTPGYTLLYPFNTSTDTPRRWLSYLRHFAPLRKGINSEHFTTCPQTYVTYNLDNVATRQDYYLTAFCF